MQTRTFRFRNGLVRVTEAEARQLRYLADRVLRSFEGQGSVLAPAHVSDDGYMTKRDIHGFFGQVYAARTGQVPFDFRCLRCDQGVRDICSLGKQHVVSTELKVSARSLRDNASRFEQCGLRRVTLGVAADFRLLVDSLS